jgi:hypothetical protein
LARWAQAGHTPGEGVPTGQEHLVHGPGFEVGAPELKRPDTGPVLDGRVLDDIAGERHGQPFGPGASRYGQLNLLQEEWMDQRERSPDG